MQWYFMRGQMVRIEKNKSLIRLRGNPITKIYQTMDACFGEINTKGFSSALQNRQLPPESHFSYGGCFNQLKFSIGPKATKPLELYLGYARAQNQNSLFDSSINNYLTIFTKGNKDGEDRDDRILNAVIILDISGSMGSGLTSMGQGCRLQLAKEAILMFFSKLRPTDSFGLVVFDNKADVLIPVQKVSDVSFDAVSNMVKSIQTRGGTTLITGFAKANSDLRDFLSKTYTPEQVKSPQTQNRFIMITDVQDNSISNAHEFIRQVQDSGIHTTIIGVSDSFRSQYCEKMIEVKGFNYFCATELGDLKKYLFQNFSFTFFPSNFDIQINVESDNLKAIEVFGTVDADKVPTYNAEAENNYIVSKTKSSFPSDLSLTQNGHVRTFGGLILVKLKLRNPDTNVFDGRVKVSYRAISDEQEEEIYPIHYESPSHEQYYSEEALYEAMCAFFYAYEVKNILKSMKEGSKDVKRYSEGLEKMKMLVPEQKKQQLSDLIVTLRNGTGHNHHIPRMKWNWNRSPRLW